MAAWPASLVSSPNFNFRKRYQVFLCVPDRYLCRLFSTACITRSCTCPGEDHPGPSTNVGRGAPEIDLLEVEHGSITQGASGTGQMVSQSARFAPFTHDYLYQNDTQDKWHIYSPNITTPDSHQYVIVLLSDFNLARCAVAPCKAR